MTSLLLQGKRAVALGAGGTMGSAASDRVRMVTGTTVTSTAGSALD
jgi:hypothetical protein